MQILPTLHELSIITQSRQWLTWNNGLLLAIVSSFLFLASSTLAYAFGATNPLVSGLIGLAFGVAAICAGLIMIYRGGELAALAYFLIGVGIFFGVGTFIATVDDNAMVYFSEGQRALLLPKVNLVNSVAIFLIVSVAALFCRDTRDEFQLDNGLVQVRGPIRRNIPLILVLSYLCHSIEWLTFASPPSPYMMSLLSLLMLVPLFGVFVGGMCLHMVTKIERLLIILLTFLFSFEGLLTFMKMTTMLPFLALAIGIWIGGRYRIWSAIVIVGLAAFFFGIAWLLISFGRGHVNYEPQRNTPMERIEILVDVVQILPEFSTRFEGVEYNAFGRLAPTQFSAHFIRSYDVGEPGETLEPAFIVLIPRIIWPEKPLIAGGRDIDGAWRGHWADSYLGIGFPAEAYWNSGWRGVLFVSVYMGFMLGWFTRRWFSFRKHGWPYVGTFLCGAIVVKISIWVETSIVGAFIGGWIKIALIICALDMAARVIRLLSQRWSRVSEEDALPTPMVFRSS